jgi:hypothetical protein
MTARVAVVIAIYQAGIDEGNATFETRGARLAGVTAARRHAHRAPQPRRVTTPRATDPAVNVPGQVSGPPPGAARGARHGQ